MVASTVTIEAPADGVEHPDGVDGILRPATTVQWTGGVGSFNVRYEWDTVATFDSGQLITQTNTSVTSPDTEVPLSDLGGQDWFFRATVIDVGDANAELASAVFNNTWAHTDTRNRYLHQQVNVGVAFDSKDSPLERQILYNDATGGTFTLSFDLQGPTGNINYNDGGSGIKTELELLSNITTVNVIALGAMIRGHANAWLIEFVDPGGESEPLITANDALLTGHTVGSTIWQYSDGGDWDVASPAAGTIGADGQNQPNTLAHSLALAVNVGVGFDADQSPLGDDPLEVQVVWNDATGGTFTLTFDGQTTGAIAYNATAGTVKTALELLSNITTVRVHSPHVRGAGGSWWIEFLDPRGESEPLMTANDTGLTGHTVGTTIVEISDGGDWTVAAPAAGTVGPDGQVNPNTLAQSLALPVNVGVGFDPTDGHEIGGGKLTPPATDFWPADGFNNPPLFVTDDDFGTLDTLSQSLGLQVNVTTTQPCPFVFSVVPSVSLVGDAVVVSGQGLVSASSPTADAWGAEVRIYETPDFAAAFVTMTITDWTAGDTLDTISAQVPVGATSGHVAVVHTTTPSCSGSNFTFLEVIAVAADLDAGWWVEVWNIRGTQRLIANVPVSASSCYFQKIKNEVGSGWVEIPAQIDDPSGNVTNLVDTISNPKAVPPVETLVRVYLDGILRYGFFAHDRSEPYGEKGNKKIRLSGDGRESVLGWAVAGRADEGLSNEILNPDRVFGSTVNVVKNGGYEDGPELISNGTLEALEVDPWEAVATATLALSQTVFRSGAASLRITPAAVNDGAREQVTVVSEAHGFAEGWAKDTVGSGDTAEFRVYWEDSGGVKTVLDSGTVILSTLWQQVQLEFTAPVGVTTLFVEWRNTVGGTAVFYVDDHTGIASVDPWVKINNASVITLDRTFVAAGDNAMKVVASAINAGGRQTMAVSPNTNERFEARITGTAGDLVRLRCIIDGVAVIDEKTLTGSPTFDTFTVAGVTGSGQSTLQLDVQARDVAGYPHTFYVDEVKGNPGEAAASGGFIGLDLITAAQLRGAIPFVQTDFTATLDSKGDVYDDPNLALAVRHDEAILSALDTLVTFGMDWQMTDGYVLQLFNELGTDLTQLVEGQAPMLDAGKPIVGGSIEGESPRATKFFAEGAGGITTSGNRPDWESTLEVREAWLTNAQAADTATLGKLVTAALNAEEARGLALKLELARATSLRPFVDFDVGDTINVSIPSDADEATGADPIEGAFRVVAIAVLLEAEGTGVRYTVDLNRLEYERDAKAAAILARLIAKGEERTGLGADAGISSGALGGSTSTPTSTPTTGDTGIVPSHKHVIPGDLDDPGVGGDLSGQLPNPIVAGLRGRTIGVEAPAAKQAYVWSGTEWLPVRVAEVVSSVVELEEVILTWTDGNDPLTTGVGNIEFGLPIGWAAADLLEIYGNLSVAPTGGPFVFDVNKNGTTIITGDVTIADGVKNTGATLIVPTVTTAVKQDVFTVDNVTVNGTPARLVVSLRIRRTA